MTDKQRKIVVRDPAGEIIAGGHGRLNNGLYGKEDVGASVYTILERLARDPGTPHVVFADMADEVKDAGANKKGVKTAPAKDNPDPEKPGEDKE